MKLKNKKGLAPLVIIAIIGGLALLGIFGGWLTAYKMEQTVSDIPTGVWIGLIILFIILILPKRK